MPVAQRQKRTACHLKILTLEYAAARGGKIEMLDRWTRFIGRA